MTLCTADVEVHPVESDQTNQPQQNVSVASQQGQQSLRPSVIFSEQDLSNALRSVLGGNLSDVSGLSQVSVGMATWTGNVEQSMTSPRDVMPTGSNVSANLPDSDQAHPSGTTVTITSMPRVNGQPVDLSVPPSNAFHWSSSMATVPVTNHVSNSERNPQDVSAVMEQTLKLQDMLLSQLERNKSVIQELQERSESCASVILSRTETHDPDTPLMRSSSEQQGTPQVLTPIAMLSRDSGVGMMSSVQSG